MKIEITLDNITELKELGAYLCNPGAKEPIVKAEAKKAKHKAPDADPEPVKEPEEATEPVPDLKDVREITIALKDYYSNEERKALIVEFGGTSASNIPEENRAAYISAAKKMMDVANE